MNKIRKKRLYRAAFNKWGFTLQMGMLMEECAELIQATHKVIRKTDSDNNTWRNLSEEMADVEIMIEQLKCVLTCMNLEEGVNTAKHEKLLKLEKMVDNEDDKN